VNVEAVVESGRGRERGEVTVPHTRILRTTLAVEDCYAYWQKVDLSVPAAERAQVAFKGRWFGLKSEARVRTLMGDMLERFDAQPEALALLHELQTIPAVLRPWVCHVHTQLADPIYRRLTGELLPTRRALGYATVDREIVARWVEEWFPGRWSGTTAIKFGSNLLAAAFEAGLLAERRDPRKLRKPAVPDVIVGYALYLLRDVKIEGSLTANPYLRSLGVEPESFAEIAVRVPGIRFAEVGGVAELTFSEPSLAAWGRNHLRAAE
jgi:hypothetical protein